MVEFCEPGILPIQSCFVIKDNNQSEQVNGKNITKFILKGSIVDYMIESEQLANGELSVIFHDTKQRSIDSFYRAHYQRIEPRFLRIELEENSEIHDQYFFFNKINGEIQIIYPFHSYRE